MKLRCFHTYTMNRKLSNFFHGSWHHLINTSDVVRTASDQKSTTCCKIKTISQQSSINHVRYLSYQANSINSNPSSNLGAMNLKSGNNFFGKLFKIFSSSETPHSICRQYRNDNTFTVTWLRISFQKHLNNIHSSEILFSANVHYLLLQL